MTVGGVRLSEDSISILRELIVSPRGIAGTTRSMSHVHNMTHRRAALALAQLARAGVLSRARRGSRDRRSVWVEGPRLDEALALRDAAETRDRMVDEDQRDLGRAP